MRAWRTLAFWLFLLSSVFIVIAIFFYDNNWVLTLGLIFTCLNWLIFLNENRKRRRHKK
jgi:hypothetical protein